MIFRTYIDGYNKNNQWDKIMAHDMEDAAKTAANSMLQDGKTMSTGETKNVLVKIKEDGEAKTFKVTYKETILSELMIVEVK